MNSLFEQCQVGGLTLRNRFAMAPMTRAQSLRGRAGRVATSQSAGHGRTAGHHLLLGQSWFHVVRCNERGLYYELTIAQFQMDRLLPGGDKGLRDLRWQSRQASRAHH